MEEKRVPPREEKTMLQSHVIEVDGAFLGAAVRNESGFRFVAIDLRVEQLDGSIWPTLADAKRLASQLYRHGRLLSAPVVRQ
ncbi:Hypothetical protein GbCGDNIH9_1223 [Granulibacter bethesdensis]|uniref:Uncharacterized protein n=2 Tax=Granulibacter bethesdensis TaxID=364410 RepID=A0AAC9P8E9_9PROT|nr:Hypothetical protein GbCGDNIH9_1223 [Granulibacter bethesdensis]APH62102.1 Hypothetical protein GbCGDNIH8_1223 [Granulibacter bethesdensis]